MQMTFNLATLRQGLFSILVFLVYGGLCAEFCDDVLNLSDPYGLQAFFSLSEEGNLPTWFVSCLLSACAWLLVIIAVAKQQHRAPYWRHWWGLAGAFFYISLDEFVQIHEAMNAWFDWGGILYFGWVMPAGIAVIIFALAYARFLTHLPRPVRDRFLVAGAIYVAGALGMELPLGYWTDLSGNRNFTYALIDFVEESLEMLGVTLFFLALVAYVSAPTGTVQIALQDSVVASADTGAQGPSVT